VILYNPTKQIYGGSAAGPIFADITSDALRSLGIPPSDEAATLYPLTWG
jgi:cell division protein FtsI (penicillin-binding protein 3)